MESDRYRAYVERLLDILCSWVPYSVTFRIALAGLLHGQNENSKALILTPPEYAVKSWFSIDCYVVAYSYNESGNLNVVRIYMPDNVFTDLTSFLQNRPAKIKLMIIQGENLLYIKKEDFNTLKTFPETFDLIQYVMFMEQEIEAWRVWIITLKDEQKIEQFSQRYPMNQLPNHICASFLQMTPSRYSAEKAQFNRNNRNF